ncbi:MAG: DNA-3-methyladenine glycosylase family protein [Burkholderiales bacterium]
MRVTLRPLPMVDFALTARVLRRSTRNPIDRVDDDGTWSRAVVLSRGPALLRGRQRGATIAFQATPADASDRPAIRALVTRLFSLELDLAPFWRRVRREPGLAELARRCAGLRPQRFATLFEALANGICCQQLSLASGLTRLGHLAGRFGPRTPDGLRTGSPDSVRLARAPLSALRRAGLTARRAGELRDLARLPLDLFERELSALPDEAARARLLELPGIGPWTADYVLLRGLGRLDVFPSGDVGAANTLGRILGRVIEPRGAAKIAARFAPFRGMLYFSMLGYTLCPSNRNDSARVAVQTPSSKEQA